MRILACSLTEYQLLGELMKGYSVGYVQCDIQVPDIWRANVDYFPPIPRNAPFSRNDVGDLMKNYAEEGLLSQPLEMLISIITLQNGTLLTPLLLLYLQLELVCTKINHLVEYTPKKCFNQFVQSAVDARRQGDENPNSSVVSGTMKLLAHSS